MPPGAWLLFAIFAAAAVQSAVALATLRSNGAGESVFSTPEADATHLVMNAVMAAMVTPAYTAAARSLALVLLALTAGGVALALVRHRPGAHAPGPLSFQAYAVAAAYHVLMLGAMIYALIAMVPSMGAMCSAPMAGMGAMSAPQPRWFTVTHALAAVFAIDAATGTAAVVAFPRQLLAAEAADPGDPARGPRGAPAALDHQVSRLRLGYIPHLVMDVGMIWMLAVS